VTPWTEALETLAPEEPVIPGAPAIIAVNKCPQTLFGGDVSAPFVGPVDEDCLYLNVVTPKAGARLPVMVWIHGGGNVLGEGLQTDGGTSGTKLADTENVVVVSMNYRFGPFGFLAHEALSEESEYGGSGNYGLMDQVAALRWVRDNVEAFGGDPENITLFGESAGGLNTCALVSSPQAKGLFHRAIMQSGTCYRPWPTLSSAHAHGERFAELAGCDNESDALACLRGKPWKELHDAWAPDPAEAGFIGYAFVLVDLERKYLQWSPILDGYFFEEQPIPAMQNGRFNKVPLMMGFTREEARLFAWLAEDEIVGAGVDIDESNYEDLIAYILGDNTALAEAAVTGPYAADKFPDPGDAYAAASTDALFRCPVLEQASATSGHVPTYIYEFRYPNAEFALDDIPVLPGLDRAQFVGWGDGAFHSADIQYVFGVPSSPTKEEFAPESVDVKLWETMRGYFARFARTGDPNGDGTTEWPQFSNDDPRLLALDSTVEAANDGPFEACTFWEGTDYLIPSY
jgi:para-nitrobenzyl esterase